MSFFDRFKKTDGEKKEEKPKKEKKPKKEEAPMKQEEAAWATSKEKVKEEDEPIDEPIEAENEEEKPAAKKQAAKGKVWHITKRNDGMWQVKAEGAARATKLFKTKAEAEKYVKTLQSNNEGSKVVKHKKTGEFQKK